MIERVEGEKAGEKILEETRPTVPDVSQGIELEEEHEPVKIIPAHFLGL